MGAYIDNLLGTKNGRKLSEEEKTEMQEYARLKDVTCRLMVQDILDEEVAPYEIGEVLNVLVDRAYPKQSKEK